MLGVTEPPVQADAQSDVSDWEPWAKAELAQKPRLDYSGTTEAVPKRKAGAAGAGGSGGSAGGGAGGEGVQAEAFGASAAKKSSERESRERERAKSEEQRESRDRSVISLLGSS